VLWTTEDGVTAGVAFFDSCVGLLHNENLFAGDRVDVTLTAITTAGYRLVRYRVGRSTLPFSTARRSQPQPPKRKQYAGLGVRTWEDVAEVLKAGGWTVVARNSNEHWQRTIFPAGSGTRPLKQSVFLALSPSDGHHGPQKAATTIRRLDRERDAFLDGE